MKISEGLRLAGALAVCGGIAFGLPIAGYLRNEEWQERYEDKRAAQVQSQTRTGIVGVIKSTEFRPSDSYLGPGVGRRLDEDSAVSYGPSMFSLNSADAYLAFLIESSAGSVRIWKIKVATNGKSDEVLADLAKRLEQGKTVKIASGIETEEGTLNVNLQDI